MNKIISVVDSFGLSKDKEYEILFEYDTVYSVKLDNGNIACRNKEFFIVKNELIVCENCEFCDVSYEHEICWCRKKNDEITGMELCEDYKESEEN